MGVRPSKGRVFAVQPCCSPPQFDAEAVILSFATQVNHKLSAAIYHEHNKKTN